MLLEMPHSFATMGAAEKTNGAILMDDYQGRVVEGLEQGHTILSCCWTMEALLVLETIITGNNNDGATMGTDQLTPIIIPDM